MSKTFRRDDFRGPKRDRRNKRCKKLKKLDNSFVFEKNKLKKDEYLIDDFE
jgi:hypothetical protein